MHNERIYWMTLAPKVRVATLFTAAHRIWKLSRMVDTEI
jgi:hypothetical protein